MKMIDRDNIFRHEWKYLLSQDQAELLKRRLQPFLKLDSHASQEGYIIRSLYFDDINNSAYNQKLMGVYSRKKWRVRIYNFSDSKIALERKKKRGNYIYKESVDLTRDEFEKIIGNDHQFLLNKKDNLYKEFYFECMSNLLRPKVIVDYNRIPLTMEEGTVRITFDSLVAAAVGSYDIFDPSLAKLPAMDPNNIILEVKYTEFLPQLIKQLLPCEAQEFVAFSKYVACYDAAHHLTDLTAGISKTHLGWRK